MDETPSSIPSTMADQDTCKSSENSSNKALAQKVFSEDPAAPATIEDKRRWMGFCEIESEPAFFNSMLRDFGVEGVKVQEVVSLDDEMLALLPQPVYGLIFLFKWTEEDPIKQEQSCPEGIWFANQTVNNACASVALLNIVNNIPEIQVGDNLCEFKRFTAEFSPALRGDAISNFEFVKEIHNSFARKMDMLNADLMLKSEAASKQKGKKKKTEEDETDAGFHFIAFVPVDGSLWKLDGLERQPMCLGRINGGWLSQATPDIQARMAQYEESQIEFAILSLVRDPLLSLLSDLAENVKAIITLSTRLDLVQLDGESFITSDDEGASQPVDVLVAAEPGLGLTQDMIDDVAQLPPDVTNIISAKSNLAVCELWVTLSTAQQELRTRIQEEIQSRQMDEERANARRRDFGAKMQKFAEKLVSKAKP